MAARPPVNVVVPCGGGGLAAGIALALAARRDDHRREPEGWDDMRRSLAAGWIEPVGRRSAADALRRAPDHTGLAS